LRINQKSSRPFNKMGVSAHSRYGAMQQLRIDTRDARSRLGAARGEQPTTQSANGFQPLSVWVIDIASSSDYGTTRDRKSGGPIASIEFMRNLSKRFRGAMRWTFYWRETQMPCL
jgi:hypothetical protein